jgi:hypothetical protein
MNNDLRKMCEFKNQLLKEFRFPFTGYSHGEVISIINKTYMSMVDKEILSTEHTSNDYGY